MITNDRSRWNHRCERGTVICAPRARVRDTETEARTCLKRPRSRAWALRTSLRARSSTHSPSSQWHTPELHPKSVPTEYYRPNTESCGGNPICLKKRRISRCIFSKCDLRRASDGPMQNGHDCESGFESTSKSDHSRPQVAKLAFGSAATTGAQSLGRSATTATATSAQPGAARAASRHAGSPRERAPGRRRESAPASAEA